MGQTHELKVGAQLDILPQAQTMHGGSRPNLKGPCLKPTLAGLLIPIVPSRPKTRGQEIDGPSSHVVHARPEAWGQSRSLVPLNISK